MKYGFQQVPIIAHRDGHALISAGPGCGKTTTLVAFIMGLMEEGYLNSELLTLMFSKSAKVDFDKKLRKKSKDSKNIPEVRTFHSLAYTIVSALESKGLMVKCELSTSQKFLEKLSLDCCMKTVGRDKFKEIQNKQSKVIDIFVSFLNLVKANVYLSPKETFDNLGLDSQFDFFPQAFEEFESNRKYFKLRFFDDLLYDLANIIITNESVKSWLGNKKKYVMVDEYQDTNVTQSVILKAIIGETGYCIAVGDADQSLYEFRGAHPGIMTHDFDVDFPNAKKFSLSHTYRFGDKLSLLASSLIINNKDRFDEVCISHENNPDTKVNLLGCENFGSKSLSIISNKVNEGYNYGDINILVRLYSQSVPIELELLKAGLKVNIEGGYSALKSKEMNIITSLLELSTGSFSNFSISERRKKFEAILKFPHIMLNVLVFNDLLDKLSSATKDYGQIMISFFHKDVKKYQLNKVRDRGYIIKFIESQKDKTNKVKSHALINRYVSESDLEDGLSFTSMTEQELSESLDRIKAILDYIKHYDCLPTEMLMSIEEFRFKSDSSKKDIDSITIMSIHRSKGLEFPVVIVPGLIEGKFPYEPKKSMVTGNHIDGERRLLYVAITRAIDELYVLTQECSTLSNYLESGVNRTQAFSMNPEPSKFIFETDYFRLNKANFTGDSTPMLKRYAQECEKAILAED